MPAKDVDVSELAKNLHVPRFAVDDLDCVNLRAWQLRALCSAVIEQDALIAKAVASERERIVRRLREIADYECGCVEDGNLTRENAEQIEREGWA